MTLADFELIRRLGDGSYSQVVLARHRATGVDYALKVVDKQHVVRHGTVDQVRRERNLLDRLTDEGIVRLHFTFQDALSLYFGLDYCPGGELYDQIRVKGRLEASTAQFYAAEVVLMLEALRKEGIVHRDLKPENLLLTASGHLKLIDFGSAKDLRADPAYQMESRGSIDLRARGRKPHGSREEAAQTEAPASEDPSHSSNDGSAHSAAAADDHEANTGEQGEAPVPREKKKRTVTLVGTADYVSPEVLQNDPVTYAADLWALGCVIYQMFTGRPPFKSGSEYLTFQKIVAAEYTPLPEEACPDARDLVEKLLRLEPEERLGAGAGGLEDLKAHPFFKGVDWDGLRSGAAPDPAVVDLDSLGSASSSFDWELQSLAAALPKIPSHHGIDLLPDGDDD